MAQLGGSGPGSLLRLLPGCQVGLEEPASKFTPKANRQASRATEGHFSSLSQSCSGRGSWLPAGKDLGEGGRERKRERQGSRSCGLVPCGREPHKALNPRRSGSLEA